MESKGDGGDNKKLLGENSDLGPISDTDGLSKKESTWFNEIEWVRICLRVTERHREVESVCVRETENEWSEEEGTGKWRENHTYR